MKNCPGCKKPLRSDNTRGACAQCINDGLAPRKEAHPGVPKRFRATAKALGFDPDALLGDFMASWLAERQ